MDEHTRAPKNWTLSKTRKNGQFVVQTETNVPGCLMTLVTCGFKPYAELIAAAPDLLEACLSALKRFEFLATAERRFYSTDNTLWMNDLADAIAKAEGRK